MNPAVSPEAWLDKDCKLAVVSIAAARVRSTVDVVKTALCRGVIAQKMDTIAVPAKTTDQCLMS